MFIIQLAAHLAGERCVHIDLRDVDQILRRCGMSESFPLRLQGGKFFAKGEARTTFEFMHALSVRMQIVTWKSFPCSPVRFSYWQWGLAWEGMYSQVVVPTHPKVRRNKRSVAQRRIIERIRFVKLLNCSGWQGRRRHSRGIV